MKLFFVVLVTAVAFTSALDSVYDFVASGVSEDDFEDNLKNETRGIGVMEGLGYGDRCSIPDPPTTPDPCDQLKNFACTNETCACKTPSEMKHNGVECVVLVDGKCLEQTGQHIPMKCNVNSYCDQTEHDVEGTCRCKDNTEKDDGLKICKQLHGGECTDTSDCKSNAFLACTNQTCRCDRQTALWGSTERSCKSLFGGECSDGPPARQCFERAGLSGSTQCDNGVCACAPNHLPSEGVCLKGLDEICEDGSQCHPNFSCEGTDPTEKKCSCKSTEVLIQGECHLRAGQPCELGGQPCGPHSLCGNATSGNGTTTCNCEPSYEADAADGICKGVDGAACANDSECHAPLHFVCNNGTCGCGTGYALQSGKCIALVGTGCDENADCQTNVCTNNKCACFQGSTPSGTTCILDHDSECDGTWSCNAALFMGCVNGRCACESDNFVYRPEYKPLCLVKAGGTCDVAGTECVQNAGCAGTPRVCTCIPGHTKNETTGDCNPEEAGGGGGSGSSFTGSLYFVLFSVVATILKY